MFSERTKTMEESSKILQQNNGKLYDIVEILLENIWGIERKIGRKFTTLKEKVISNITSPKQMMKTLKPAQKEFNDQERKLNTPSFCKVSVSVAFEHFVENVVKVYMFSVSR